MNDSTNREIVNHEKIAPSTIAIMTTVMALLSPVALFSYSFSIQEGMLISMLWVYYTKSGNFLLLALNPPMLITTLTLTFLRLAFIVFLHRFYSGKTTKKRCAIVGIASELQLPTIFLFPVILSLPFGSGITSSFPLIIPIPILVLTGFLITRIVVAPDTRVWIEKEKSQTWWEKPGVVGGSPSDSKEVHSDSTTELISEDWLDER